MSEAEKYRIKYLIEQFSNRKAGHSELEELTGLLQGSRHDEQIKSLLEEMAMDINIPVDYSEARLKEILAGMQGRLVNSHDKVQDQSPVISIETGRLYSRKLWKRLAVAVSIILVAGISSYLFFFENSKDNTVQQSVITPDDIKAPKSNRAMITLANGKTVYLDDAVNGQLAVQQNVQLVKLADGQIVYQSAPNEISNKIQYNTLSNPRGSKVINMQLADGSRVWLNAGSTVTYPITFTGNERIVEMTGEGYFEVVKNAGKPFKVRMPNSGEVEVLGTQFNINSYTDEPNVKTTLFEGSIQISSYKKNQSLVLIPGQQAQLFTHGQINLNNAPDLQSVIAWKEDKFIFQNADLYFIMRQLERWYDIEVSYSGERYTDEFVGIISRDVNISEILKMLEKIGNVKFELNGRQLLVK